MIHFAWVGKNAKFLGGYSLLNDFCSLPNGTAGNRQCDGQRSLFVKIVLLLLLRLLTKQFPKTKIDRDGNYTIDSVYWLNCNWCVRVCKLKRQNNCTKPKCCVQQSVLTVILILYFRSQQGKETSGRGKREKANEALSLSKRGPIIMYMYNCICRVYGAKASELNFSINMDW